MSHRQFSLVILGSIVIALLLIYWGKETAVTATGAAAGNIESIQEMSPDKITQLEEALEKKLKEKLQLMKGVGRVEIFISLSSGVVHEYANNENVTKRTQKQTDKAGGVSEITEETSNHQLAAASGSSQPVVIMEQRPAINGVLVIAEGAGNAQIKGQLQAAVQALLALPTDKVSVEAMAAL
ncbi:MAG: stage III sporulation protein AH [Peptococcaceae bacterium]|jgi:stage III sporulation protein AG|nr:stage III sporulation protein AH [Peptococcaceae bacterium]